MFTVGPTITAMNSPVGTWQGCRGDWIPIPIPHGIPIPTQLRNPPYLYPTPCVFSLDKPTYTFAVCCAYTPWRFNEI